MHTGLGASAEIEEPVTLDEDPFTGHVTETDVSEAVQYDFASYYRPRQPKPCSKRITWSEDSTGSLQSPTSACHLIASKHPITTLEG